MTIACANELLDIVAAPVEEARPLPATLVLVAHPMDETLGLGARLSRFAEARFVCVTDGAPRDLTQAKANGFRTREEYGLARRAEVHAAFARAGLPPRHAQWLEVIDQQVTYCLSRVTRRLERMMTMHTPELLLTQPYDGAHPDRDAVAFAARAACRLLARTGRRPPTIIEMASPLSTGAPFLSCDGVEEVTRELSPGELQAKQSLLACFPTQRAVLAGVDLSSESFRVAPEYDFAAPPHEGPLAYESLPVGVAGPRWRTIVKAACCELGLRGSSWL